ncbi:aldose 1-epimerase family protein [Brevibacterium casei]|uniref:Aldose 1-epimerase n=1 Tax=Brevibacterium casei CIP 102111 TaxID=1255625 RepID=A0A2H1JL63_9MICO|nr:MULTISPECIES: aldose 1-epimerase family protein [Brevibacterium]SMX88230.1 aldose 1-epimerase [Brevibacterium casei CIP 102111]
MGGGYSAEIASVGATLRSLSYHGRHLTSSFEADEVRPASLGTCLLPWPNRIADGKYEFGGCAEQLPITELSRGNAIHGLAGWLDWEVLEVDIDRVKLAVRIAAQPGYPHTLEATAEFAVDHTGLQWTVAAANVGSTAAPYGIATHPYLVLPTGRPDDWELHVPASSVLDVDEERKLPRGLHSVADFRDGAFDFTSPRQIGSAVIDHAMTDIKAENGIAAVRLGAEGAAGVSLRWDPQVLPWVQIFTGDLPNDPGRDRRAVAVEAMTCPPDAFNSGTDLIVLESGQEHRATWHISATGEED